MINYRIGTLICTSKNGIAILFDSKEKTRHMYQIVEAYRRRSLDTMTSCDFNSLLVGGASIAMFSDFKVIADSFLLFDGLRAPPTFENVDGLWFFIAEREESEEDEVKPQSVKFDRLEYCMLYEDIWDINGVFDILMPPMAELFFLGGTSLLYGYPLC